MLRSTVGFMALHGGSQDRGTDSLARRAAARTGASYYAIVQAPWSRVHIPSHRLDPEGSPILQRFLAHVTVAISVHGFGREGFALWLDSARGLVIEPYGPSRKDGQSGPITGMIVGGQNARLVERTRAVLAGRFAGYRVADPRVRLGYHRANPVNLPRAAGVQIELPPGLRGIGPYGERVTPVDDELTAELVEALVEVARLAGDELAGD